MSRDNWERLVAAVLKKERLRELALCPSFASSSSFNSLHDRHFSFDLDGLRTGDRTTVASSSRGPAGNSSANAAGRGVAGKAALLFAAPARALAMYRRKKQDNPFIHDFGDVQLGHLRRFSLRELQAASDNFSTKNILRRGGPGKVYRGRLADGSLVEFKRLQLKEHMQGGEKLRFLTEIEISGLAVHQNLLQLLGFCMTATEWIPVYPHMANGNVASCLRERPESQPPLDWPIRQRIALGSARGLAYLHDHRDHIIIHRDVKAANILLDEDFEPVVGDFGLAKLMGRNDTHVTTEVCGTIGHIAPEYFSTGECSEKTDVFGYGIMLLELVSGQREFDLARLANDEDVMLLDWVKGLLKQNRLGQIVDANMMGNFIDEVVEQLIQVALLCTLSSPTDRPRMAEVVRMLEGDGVAARWEEWLDDEFSHMFIPDTNNWVTTESDIDIQSEQFSEPIQSEQFSEPR